MPIIDLSNPINVLIALILFILVVFLAKEIKRSNVTCILLLTFLTIIAGHCIEYVMVQNATEELLKTIANCIAVDFIFVFLSFIAYLWMDDVEAKERKIKTIDNSLDWFWKKV
ncbi:MAG: hypothetical protein GX682_01635 [Clostridiaceae bacterium]|nr:hypothetical protein [Clostridiaceae bacterium]